MEKKNYVIENADNGVILRSIDSGTLEVFHEKEGESVRDYIVRALSLSVASELAGYIINGSENLK